MAFRPVNFEEGHVVLMPVATSQAVVTGHALVDNGSGLLALASAGGGVDVNYVAAETITTTATTLVKCIPTRGIRFNADVDAAAAQTDVGTLADLASVSTIDPDASADDIFYIESIDLTGGAVGTSTRIFGYFQHANET